MQMEDLNRAARIDKASTGVGAAGFHPKVPLDVGTERVGNVVILFGKGGGMRLLASSSQHIVVLSCSELCHE